MRTRANPSGSTWSRSGSCKPRCWLTYRSSRGGDAGTLTGASGPVRESTCPTRTSLRQRMEGHSSAQAVVSAGGSGDGSRGGEPRNGLSSGHNRDTVRIPSQSPAGRKALPGLVFPNGASRDRTGDLWLAKPGPGRPIYGENPYLCGVYTDQPSS